MTSRGGRRAAGLIGWFTDEPWFMGEPPHRGLPPVPGLITLDAKVQVRREVDAGNHRRDMTREHAPKPPGGRHWRQRQDRNPSLPGGTAEDRARWLAHPVRGHSPRQTQRTGNPRPFSGLFHARAVVRPVTDPPRQSGIRHPDRNPDLTPTVHCSGPVGGDLTLFQL